MSKDTVASAQLALEELDRLLAMYGVCRVAQKALNAVPNLAMSRLARKHLVAGIARIQSACYNPKVPKMSFTEMMQLGKSVIEAGATKNKLQELLYDAVVTVHAEESDKLERSEAMAATAR